MTAQPDRLDLTERRRAIEERIQTKPEVELVPRQIDLSIRYTDPETGAALSATVPTRVLDAEGRRVAAALQAELAAAPVSTLASHDQLRTRALGWLTVSLVKPPAWLTKWMGEDDALLFSIFDKVGAHEARFFRRDVSQGGGSSARPTLVVDSPLDTAPEAGSDGPHGS